MATGELPVLALPMSSHIVQLPYLTPGTGDVGTGHSHFLKYHLLRMSKGVALHPISSLVKQAFDTGSTRRHTNTQLSIDLSFYTPFQASLYPLVDSRVGILNV